MTGSAACLYNCTSRISFRLEELLKDIKESGAIYCNGGKNKKQTNQYDSSVFYFEVDPVKNCMTCFLEALIISNLVLLT